MIARLNVQVMILLFGLSFIIKKGWIDTDTDINLILCWFTHKNDQYPIPPDATVCKPGVHCHANEQTQNDNNLNIIHD